MQANSSLADSNFKKFESQILAEEMEGYNLVASMNPEDIFNTIEAINTSFVEPILVQTKNPAESYGLEHSKGNFFSRFFNNIDSAFGLYTLVEYWVKQRLVSDNFYAYSLNRTLIEMPISELRKIPGLKTQYL